jgi:adenylate cyclase, class 2
MPLEIEAKIKVDAHEPIRQRLSETGAKRLGCVLETNTFLDDADRSLFAGGKGLRLRQLDVISGPRRTSTLTFKGPKQQGPLKIREEIELPIPDADSALALFGALGFTSVLCFQKRRETWTLGGCHVELDELPHLGCYIEVEGPGEDAIHDVLQRLGLADRPVITDSYIALLVDHCQKHGVATDRIELPNR